MYRPSLGTRGETRRAAAEAETALLGRVRPWSLVPDQPCPLAPHVRVPRWVRAEEPPPSPVKPATAAQPQAPGDLALPHNAPAADAPPVDVETAAPAASPAKPPAAAPDAVADSAMPDVPPEQTAPTAEVAPSMKKSPPKETSPVVEDASEDASALEAAPSSNGIETDRQTYEDVDEKPADSPPSGSDIVTEGDVAPMDISGGKPASSPVAAADKTGEEKVVPSSGDEGICANSEDEEAGINSGDEGAGVDSGDEGMGVATGDEGADAVTGDEGVDAATGDEGTDAALGDEAENAASGDEALGATAGNGETEANSGEEPEMTSENPTTEDLQTVEKDSASSPAEDGSGDWGSP